MSWTLPWLTPLCGLALSVVDSPSVSSVADGSGTDLTPPILESVRLEDRLGEQAELDVHLRDRFGDSVVLESLLDDDKPTLLVLAYYRCPMLCDLTLRGVARGLAELSWDPGDEYQVVTVSFDPRDEPPAADRARAAIVDEISRDIDDDAWPFLVGDEDEIQKLTDSLGFYYAYDPKTDQYAHPSGIFLLSPEGNVSRVLQGFEYAPLDLRMSLLEAGEGKTGTFAEQVLLTCFRYDPAQRRYGPYIFGFLRLGGVFMLAAVGVVLLLLVRHERKQRRRDAQEGRG